MSHKPNKTLAIQGPFVPQVGEGLKDGAFALAKAHYVGPLDGVGCDLWSPEIDGKIMWISDPKKEV